MLGDRISKLRDSKFSTRETRNHTVTGKYSGRSNTRDRVKSETRGYCFCQWIKISKQENKREQKSEQAMYMCSDCHERYMMYFEVCCMRLAIDVMPFMMKVYPSFSGCVYRTTQPGLRFVVCLQEAGLNPARRIQQAVSLPPVYFFEKGSCKVYDEPFQPGLNC